MIRGFSATDIPPEPEARITGTLTVESELSERVAKAFALVRASALPQDILQIEGFSGRSYRRFINNLIGLLPDPRYLEIGVWSGSTFCSAIYGNQVKATAIDNWSEFGGPSRIFQRRVERFKGESSDIDFIEADFRTIDYGALGPFNVYFFDGPHEEQDQYDGIRLPVPALDERFVLIIDDWNAAQVRAGTLTAIRDAELGIEYSIEIRTTEDDTYPARTGRDSLWHNGYFIAVMTK